MSRAAVKQNLKVAAEHVCPFCGSINASPDGPCPACTMEDSPAGRKATKARIGPWYVLQKRNPAAPGMKFETLLQFVKRGRIKQRSIVRGPTTHQFWRFAGQVKGLSREFGICYSCGNAIASTATICTKCNRLQEPPPNPDVFLETEPESTPLVYRQIPAPAPEPPRESPTPSVESPRVDPPAVDLPAKADVPPSVVVVELPPPPAPTVTDSPVEASSASPAADAPAEEHDHIVVPTLGAVESPQAHDLVIPTLGPRPAAAQPLAPAAASAPSSGRAAAAELAMPSPQVIDGGGSDDGSDEFGDEPGEGEEDDWSPRQHGAIGPAYMPAARMPGPVIHPRRFWLEGTLFVLVIVGALFTGLLYVDPQLRERATAVADRALAWAGLSNVGKPSPTAPAAPAPIPEPKSFARVPPTVPSPPPTSVPSAPPVTQAPPAPVEHATKPPEPAPPSNTEPPPKPPAPDDSVAAAPAAPAPPPAPADEDDFSKARNLRRRAIDAGIKGDYATAVQLFQQIKDLPREAWPGDLELRLNAARRNAAAHSSGQ